MRTALVARFAPPAVAAVLLALIVIGGPLATGARAVGVGCIVASAAAAALVRREDLRAHATVALAVAAVTAAGQIKGGGRYALGSTVFVFACIACLRAPRASGTRARGRVRAWTALAVVSLASTALLVRQLPRAGGWVEARIGRWLGAMDADEATGFSSNLRLGSTHGMLVSERPVLRIEGAAPEYLRGAVYDRYEVGAWTGAFDEGDSSRRIVEASLAPERASSRLTFARGARLARGREARFFLPGEACELGTHSRRVVIDQGAVVHPDPPLAPAIWLGPSECAISAAPPSARDLEVPAGIAEPIAAVAGPWTAGTTSDRAKLEALALHLATFGYSLDVRRSPRLDPVVDFLTTHREGHCELFASALALLARSRGVPARVVTGYRGGDLNRAFGYTVVRERHAHAWVEAWVDGAWRSFDPTPPVDGVRREERGVDAATDAMLYAIERAAAALGRVTLAEWGIGLGAALALLYAIRTISRLAQKRRPRAGATLTTTPALPAFDLLESRLVAAGHARAESEPVESFARRIVALEAPWSDAAADALARYAELRYGDVGDEEEVVRALDRAARAVTASRAPRPSGP